MKTFLFFLLFFALHSATAQTTASQSPDNRILVVTNPKIEFSADVIATYDYSYYRVGGGFQNQYSTYDFRSTLVTPGPGRYVVYTFVNVYRRSVPGDQTSSLYRVGMYKYQSYVILL